MKTAILVISFGTSHLDALENSIAPIERDIARAFPDCAVYRAFTSGMIIRKLRRDVGLLIDTPEEAVNRLAQEGYDALLLMPTHIIAGTEYEKVSKLYEALRVSSKFKRVSLTTPLLCDDSDYILLSQMLKDGAACIEGTLLLMGHGSEHAANASYAKLQNLLPRNTRIACVEGAPFLDDVVLELHSTKVRRVTLMPLMIVAGDHAKNDMAGNEDDSWQNRLGAEGFVVDIRMKGLGEAPSVRDLFVERVRQSLEDKIQ